MLTPSPMRKNLVKSSHLTNQPARFGGLKEHHANNHLHCPRPRRSCFGSLFALRGLLCILRARHKIHKHGLQPGKSRPRPRASGWLQIPGMTYINHITLQTGHTRRSDRAEVSGETLARVGPWLAALVESGQPAPLPVSGLADYTGHATVLDGALIVTISGPAPTDGPMAGKSPPLISMGVAQRSRHGAALWPLMTGTVMPPAKPSVQRPGEPWAAVAIWPTAALYPESAQWLGDLERCIAWAWMERSP